MALSAQLLDDLQRDIGISNDQSVFTDAVLERLYARAESNQDKTIYLAFRQLLAQTKLFYDFTIGMTTEKRSQIRSNMREMVALWKDEVGFDTSEVDSIGMTGIPEKKKDKPWREGGRNKRLRDEFFDWDGDA